MRECARCSQAVEDALMKMSSDTVGVKVVYTGVGPVTESDIDLACATGSSVIAFNTKFDSAGLESYAKKSGVPVMASRIIYQLLDDVGRLLVGLAPDAVEEVVVGEVRAQCHAVPRLRREGARGHELTAWALSFGTRP